jgi:hypothetical protein
MTRYKYLDKTNYSKFFSGVCLEFIWTLNMILKTRRMTRIQTLGLNNTKKKYFFEKWKNFLLFISLPKKIILRRKKV